MLLLQQVLWSSDSCPGTASLVGHYLLVLLSLWFCRALVIVPLCILLGGCGRKGKDCWEENKEVMRLLYFFLLVLSVLHNPLGNVLGKPPLSFLPLDPLGSDLVDKFPAPSVRGSRLDTRPILDSRSSSPSDSDTSGFSSGSDHLSDLIVCNLSRS